MKRPNIVTFALFYFFILPLLLPAAVSASPGSLDYTFGTNGLVKTDLGYDDQGAAVAVYKSGTYAGKIVVAGTVAPVGNAWNKFAVARYNADGSLDTSFATTGMTTIALTTNGYDRASAVLIQPDDKIIVVGQADNGLQIGLVRYNANGTLDTGFGSGGIVRQTVGTWYGNWAGAVLQSDGKIAVVGQVQDSTYPDNVHSALVRFNSSGGYIGIWQADFASTYWYNSQEFVSYEGFSAVAEQSDGKLVAVGYANTKNIYYSVMTVARFQLNGGLDTSFGSGGKTTIDFGSAYSDYANSVAIQSDGGIVIGGRHAVDGSSNLFAAVRLTSAGALDTTFNTTGKATIDAGGSNEAHSLALQSDGKILLAGYTTHFGAARFNSNGSADTTFGTGGVATVSFGSNDYGYGMALQSDGKILLAGMSGSSSAYDFALARLNYQSTNMMYGSSTVTQNTNVIAPGATGDIVSVAITTSGDLSPLNATSFTCNTTGTTSTADISSARLYYTGSSAAFSTATPFGSAVNTPSGSFTITGSQTLAEGTNYFWVAYTVASGAASGNFLDAQCTSVTVGGTARTPSVTDPAGSRQIFNILAIYDINNHVPQQAGGTNNVPTSFVVTGISATNLTAGPGMTTDIFYTDTGLYVYMNWTTSANYDPGQYYQVKITPDSYKQITYSKVAFSVVADNYDGSPSYYGPTTIDLRYSTDDFVSSNVLIQKLTWTPPANSFQQTPFEVDISSLGTRSGPITFRWYGYNRNPAGDWTSTMGFSNWKSGPNGSAITGTGSNIIFKGTVSSTNTAPTFVGAATTLTVNENSGAADVKGLLHVSDTDSGQTLTWSQQTGPSHGTLIITGATASSGGTDITPGGTITYQPQAGYSGSDSFMVQVSDTFATASRTISVTVVPLIPQTITFDNPGSQTFGTTPTLTATASSGLSVTFTSSTTGVCTITSGGALTFVTTGTCTINADQAGDATYLAAPTVTQSFSVNQAGTTTAIASDLPDPSVVGEMVTFNYTVSVIAPSGGTPTGNVSVSNGTDSCTGTVAAGSCTITSTAAGTSNFTATYAGDANYTGSTSATETHTVNQADTTTAITSDLPDPSVVNQAVIFNYTVSVVAPGGGTPTGNVTVSNGTDSCTGTVAGGSCSITLASLGTGNFTASYAGDVNYTGSTSATEAHTVNQADTATMIISDVPDPSDVGQAVTVSYAVTAVAPGGGTPTGNVTVSDGADSCTGTVAAGLCSLTLSTTGVKTLTATYAGDSNFNGSASAGEVHNVCTSSNITVTNTNNDGAGSLRQAISDICPGGTIDFGVTGTITLTSGELLTDKDMTIAGPGASSLTVSGNNASRVFYVNSGVTATIQDIRISNGSVSCDPIYPINDGSGIYNAGTLTVANSTISDNTVGSVSDIACYGGGIFNGGTLTITNSTITGNSANGTVQSDGGGIFNGGTLTITNSTIFDNSSNCAGSGGSSWGGGIYNDGTATVTNSTVSGNSSNIASVYGSYGGGIFNSGILTVTNSTISGNYSVSNGICGGIYNLGFVTLANSIVAGNIIRGGLVGNCCTSGGGRITDTGGNIDDGNTCWYFTDPTSMLNTDPLLDPAGLQDNGGPTQTIALLAGSPAINAGAGCPSTDQRGISRPQGSTCDISAYEFVPTTTTAIVSSLNPSAFGQSVTFTATVSDSEAASAPTGTITFKDGGVDIAGCVSVALSGISAGCTLSTLAAGSHTITAVYSGDANFTGSTSSALTQTVNQAWTTTTITLDTPDPSAVGQAVTVSYAVTAVAPGSGTPTGNVTVSDGLDSCTGTVAAGSCIMTLTTAGARTLTATYAGDANFAGSTSSNESHTINQAGTSTAITSDLPDASVVGQAVTFNYTISVVAPSSGTPTGNVTVSNGTDSCTGTVAAGSCTITSIAAGTSNFIATYSGDANFAGSTSAAEPHTVDKANTTTAITSDAPDPSTVGQPVTVNYTVTAVAPGVGTPTGDVLVSDGTHVCMAGVSAGGCTLTFFTAGTKSLIAYYLGDSNFSGSQSDPVSHTVGTSRIRVYSADFTGDGITEKTIFRPWDGTWFIYDGSIIQWGISGDIPVSGYYDNNSTSDIAVWRPSDGRWYIRNIATVQWGTYGDIPVPGDYGGDGRTDYAVWRPSEGNWYIRTAEGNISVIQWGADGDIPVPGDYNGDGITDIAVFRPFEGNWYIRGIGTYQWGTAEDVPVPGYYNNDSIIDIAVWRPSEGNWYIRGIATYQWGTNGDIPVPGDYGGDGRTDCTVWRPSEGKWYIRYADGTNASVYWGTSGDIPLGE